MRARRSRGSICYSLPALRKLATAALAAASLAACGHPRIGPPALFPMTSVWVVPVEDIIEPPLASDGWRVFVSTREGALRAFDPSGAPVWRRDGRPARLAAGPGILVLRQADGTLVSLDPETGATRWTSSSGVTGGLPPVVDLDRVLVAGDGIAALDVATGRSLWSFPGSPVASSLPVSSGPWVLVGEADGTLRCRDRATGLPLWAYRTGGVLHASPVVDADQRAFVGTTDRRFLALDVTKGRLRWRWKVGVDVQSAGAVLRHTVLFASFEDVLYALKRSNGHMIWRAPLPSRPLSGPILVGDSVLQACYESELVGFDGRTGGRLGGLKTPAEIRTPPLLVGDRLYVGLRDRTLVAYTLDLTPARPKEPETPAQRLPERRRAGPRDR